jgi:protein-tyrosine-phosphatase
MCHRFVLKELQVRSFFIRLKKIQQKRPVRIVFVCTANCCRSPLAEILFEKILIEHLGSPARLKKYNIVVESAGTSFSGMSMATYSAQLLIDEENVPKQRCELHCGRLITEIKEPDLILTMTEKQKHDIMSSFPLWADRVFTLDGFVQKDLKKPGIDITDPIGRPISDYRRMKEQIKRDLFLLFEEIKDTGLIIS